MTVEHHTDRPDGAAPARYCTEIGSDGWSTTDPQKEYRRIVVAITAEQDGYTEIVDQYVEYWRDDDVAAFKAKHPDAEIFRIKSGEVIYTTPDVSYYIQDRT